MKHVRRVQEGNEDEGKQIKERHDETHKQSRGRGTREKAREFKGKTSVILMQE